MITLLLAAALPLSAQDWNPMQPFEQRFQSSVQQLTMERPPRPRNRQPMPTRTDEQVVAEATAVAIRLGRTSDTTFEADDAAVQEIASMLGEMRKSYPEIEDLSAGFSMGTSVIIELTAPAKAKIYADYPIPAGKFTVKAEPKELGFKELDEFVGSFGGSYRLSVYKSMMMLVAEFGKPLDLAKLIAKINALPSVQASGGNSMIIGGPGVPKIEHVNGEYRITLTNGWGDCMAGCMYRESWHFVSRAGRSEWIGYTTNEPGAVVRPAQP